MGASADDRVVITGPVTISGGQTADDGVVFDGPVTAARRSSRRLVRRDGTPVGAPNRRVATSRS
jgi:hypothetical protein